MAGLGMRLYIKMLQAKQNFLEEERGAVDIVAIVVLIGIAVALALFFREQIGKTLDNIFNQVNDATSGITENNF